MRVVLLSLLFAACDATSPTTEHMVEDMIQAAVPGQLTLEVPNLYAGERIIMRVTGAVPGEQVYVGMSENGVAPQSVCPPILSDCLNIEPPLTLLGTGNANRLGTVDISIPVPAGAVFTSLFLQAASFSGTSTALHRFIEAPDSDCGVGIAPPRCESEISWSGRWDCSLGQSCEDVREVFLTAGTEVDVDVTGVNGTSVVRLSATRSGTSTNLLTGNSSDWQCTGQNESASASFVAPADGVYEIAVGREWGLSAGFRGDYEATVSADPGLEDRGQVANDRVSTVGSQCGFEQVVSSDWSCNLGDSCRDVYEIDLVAGSELEVTVDSVTGNSVPILALYAPRQGSAGTNLLTNETSDRECVGQDANDGASNFIVPTTGTYRIAVGRDWGNSAGFDGTYRMTVRTDLDNSPLTLVQNDTPSPHATTVCGFRIRRSGSWDCGLGESCQDVYDFELPADAAITVLHTNLTGNSVSRLALFEPGQGLDGVNQFWGTAYDLSCEGQDQDQTAGPLLLTDAGSYRLAVGRNWGTSAGFSGTYDLDIFIVDGYPSVSQSADDILSQAIGPICF